MQSLSDGTRLMRSAEPLASYDERIGSWLDRWAQEAPNRAFIVEQTAEGERIICYRDARLRALEIAEGLLRYRLDAERPLVILAPSGIDHALLMCAALYLGVPFAPVAPAYALQSRDFLKLGNVFRLLTPGLVVVADGTEYRPALEASLDRSVPVIAMANATAQQLEFQELRGDERFRDAVVAAAQSVNAHTVAKFLFTSGSSGTPKAVINTHGMLCASAQMQRQVTAFVAHTPPVMVDWLPWNHTAGGNSIFNIILHNGGTLYIDPGRPDPEHIHATLDLLRRVSPTLYFNVPLGFEALIPYFRKDRRLRDTFFRDLQFIWYAAAAMQPSTWNALEELAIEAIGQRLLIVTGLGMTETSPLALFGNLKANGLGVVGVPAPGVELKLLPRQDRFEAAFRGPNVTPGYWRDPDATNAAFDAEGYWLSGDLLSFVDPSRPELGLRFEGRASDDFKLASGTRVAGGALRVAALEGFKPLITDLVIVGTGRRDVRALIFPDWSRCASECGLDPALPPRTVACSPQLQERLKEQLCALAQAATGSSNRIVAVMLVLEPPSASAGELTEKGTINGRFLQRNRPELVEAIFSDASSDLIIRV
jgi:feruloyl-CoA synthase